MNVPINQSINHDIDHKINKSDVKIQLGKVAAKSKTSIMCNRFVYPIFGSEDIYIFRHMPTITTIAHFHHCFLHGYRDNWVRCDKDDSVNFLLPYSAALWQLNSIKGTYAPREKQSLKFCSSMVRESPRGWSKPSGAEYPLILCSLKVTNSSGRWLIIQRIYLLLLWSP